MTHYITFFEIAAFLASLFAWPVIKTSRHLRLFPLLLFIIAASESYETFFRPDGQTSNATLYNIQVPIQYLLYLLIIYYAIRYHTNKKIILSFLIILLILFTLVTGIFFTKKDHFNVLAYAFGSILIIIGIIIKFYEMLEQPQEFNFLRDPFFYMLFVFLLFTVSTVPYFVMINWLYLPLRSRDFIMLISNVMSILNFFLYTTYTIAFLWMRLKKTTS